VSNIFYLRPHVGRRPHIQPHCRIELARCSPYTVGQNDLEPRAMPNSVIPPVSMKTYDTDFEGFSQELGGWFERFGFAVVADHGVDQAVIDGTLERAKAFFALPVDRKVAHKVPNGGGQRGYTAFGVETAKDHTIADLKEFWHRGRDLPEGHPFGSVMPPNVSVPEIDGFDGYTKAMYEGFDELGRRILRAIALYLGLEVDFFDDKVREGNSILRLLHYPAIPGDVTPGAIRAGAHGDINLITLLLGADEAGLQLLGKDGEWKPVGAPAGCVVINVGDMLSRFTNDRLPSTIHRVVNPDPERARFARYSAPFFLHYDPSILIETMEWGGPAKYPPINAQDFLNQRLAEIKLT
jgi:isopenicillin N synthase-like dioxygenase